LIFVAIVIAIKYNEDKYICNKAFAKVGGIPLNELNFLECEFFRLINFELYINHYYYNNCYNHFLKETLRITYFDESDDDEVEIKHNNLKSKVQYISISNNYKNKKKRSINTKSVSGKNNY
jgi:hypothetical protein